MSNKILSTKHNGYTFSLYYDYEHGATVMDDLFHEHTLISNHRNYSSMGPKKDKYTLDKLFEMARKGKLPKNVTPVYAYIHSGISLSLSNDSYPYNCRFDSGLFGFIISDDPGYFVQDFNDAENGSYYGFMIDGPNGEVGSCWGFGGYRTSEEMVNEMLSYCNEEISDEFRKKIINEVNSIF